MKDSHNGVPNFVCDVGESNKAEIQYLLSQLMVGTGQL